MKFILTLFFFLSFSFSADTLIDALTQGTFEKKIDLENTDGTDSKNDLKKQKVIFHYTSAPINGFRVEVENDGLSAYAKALYMGSFSDLMYTFSANAYTTNASSYTMDVNYALKRELSIGSRYTLMNNPTSLVSYSGIYTSLILDEINKGLNVGLYYDRIGLEKEGDKFSLKIKNNF
ncbi:MAG: hypothetical protein PHR87_08680 [Sulfurospirillaceae bacterium]|nr:hypothetical protein [Sulfurospirillaceae bacterium]